MADYSAFFTSTAGAGVASGVVAGAGVAGVPVDASLPAGGVAGFAGVVVFLSDE